MKLFPQLLAAFLAVVGLLGLLAVLAVALRWPGVIVFFLILAIYGCVVFTFMHYRYGRQDELIHVLITAAEAEAPLSSAVWAYLLDRPQGTQREIWVATLLFFVLPGYYWIWHRQHSFDRKLAEFARQLEHGVSLGMALRNTPGLASADTRLAVAVGQSTGRLAPCLRSLQGRRLGTAWMEAIPRLLYPLALLVVVANIVGFLVIYIVPKYQKIFSDFRYPMPDLTTRFIVLSHVAAGYLSMVPMVLLGFGAVVGMLCASTTVRWFFPIVGRFYRTQVQSRVLNMLALLLEANMPAPQALAFLAASPSFAGTASRRLAAARLSVENGQPLIDSLRRKGLLSLAAVSFAHAAERTQTLPWALKQLGDLLGGRAARFVRQFSLIATPISVVAVGFLVAFVALAMFWPLIQLLTELSE
jgi:type IV pilus assembly protein PilC